MAHGFAYLVAIMDWYSRKVLAWRVSYPRFNGHPDRHILPEEVFHVEAPIIFPRVQAVGGRS